MDGAQLLRLLPKPHVHHVFKMPHKVMPITSESTEIVGADEMKSSTAFLDDAKLTPLTNGEVSGPDITAQSLWDKESVAIVIFRRAGCPLCRLDAKIISKHFARELPHIKLIGIVKEMASTAGTLTDLELGVGTLQTKFFNNNPIYLDKERKFYEYLGNRSLLSQPLPSWNPCTLCSNLYQIKKTLEEHGIDEYNFVGEAYIQGGVIIVCNYEGVVLKYQENTGYQLPLSDLNDAAQRIKERQTFQLKTQPSEVTELKEGWNNGNNNKNNNNNSNNNICAMVGHENCSC